MLHVMDQVTPYSARVAAEVRAEMARQMLTTRELARRIDRPHNTVGRWAKGETPLDINALYLVAQGLGVDPIDLLRRADRRSETATGPSARRRVGDAH